MTVEVDSDTRTYSDKEAAEIICGAADPRAVEWLHRRLRHEAKPFLDGYKAQGRWRMRHQQVLEALEKCEPPSVHVPVVPSVGSMTRGSRRRLSA